MDWLLTKEEQEEVLCQAHTKLENWLDAIAKAEAKKLLEGFSKRLSVDGKEMFLTKCLSIRKWQALKKDLGVK